ncbi:hypothetical protein ABH931_000571 [Streptacidiphilus sp. MAP12-33]|uniref:streptophobe family protein n=1 Tax=Streptacidiphilus sp. MAP12-33 TaxID=3156266 RepID=UPI003518B0AB
MTVYQSGRPVPGGPQPGGGRAGGTLLRGLVSAAMSASWAFVAMAAVGALGVHLLGLDTHAKLGPVTAALVAMAVGGRISPTGDVSVFGIDAAAAQGSIDIMPLGLTLVGAVVLGWLFTRPLRRIAVLTAGELLVRAAGAVISFLVLLAVVAWSGNGTVSVDISSLTGGSGGSGGSGSGGGDDPFGGFGGLIGGVVGGNTKPTVGFKVDLAPTLGIGLLWVVVVLAFSVVAARRSPLPVGWQGLARTVRPVASAITTVFVGACVVGGLAGLVVGLTGNGGAKTVGGVLLGTPNGVFLAVPLGMGVSLAGKASGPLAHVLPAPINTFLAGGQGKTITVSSLAAQDGRVWLLPVAVLLMLLATGVFAAVRTPRRSASADPLGAEVGGAAVRLGVALLVVTPVLLALADVTVNANLSVFGFDAVGAGLSVTGNVALALGLGLVEGAAMGALGALLVRRFAEAKRVGPATALPGGGFGAGGLGGGAFDGGPGDGFGGGGFGAVPPGPAPAPQQPGAYPPGGPGPYGPPAPPPATPAPPAPGGYPPPPQNPYGGPSAPPPPPAQNPYGGLPQAPQPPYPPQTPPRTRPEDDNPYR